MKVGLFAAVISLGFASMAAAQAPATATPDDHPAGVNQRLENQQDRIHQGVQDGQLTKAEATRVRANDAGIRAEERVDRKANDGKLTSGERQHLEKQLNRNSRQIYRAKHNDRTRK
ncbi:MAG TPA: hypothetical protein VGH34_20660 [Vicinamibacterales bacterium]|jgi:hypothetical protein